MEHDDEKIVSCISEICQFIESQLPDQNMSDDELEVVIHDRIDAFYNYYRWKYPELFSQEEREHIKRSVQSKIKVTIGDGCILSVKHERWFKEVFDRSDKKFWNRYYKYLQKEKLFPANSLNELDKITSEIMDNVANPLKEDQAPRYGLVIGDVQSGKTNTYIGLINKAADVGYNVFIILTGVTNSLRSQTQRRVNEGFTGIERDSDTEGIESTRRPIGVRKFDQSVSVDSFTTVEDDFNKIIARMSNVSLNNRSIPVVLVCKKNKTVLNSIYKWLNNPQNTDGGKTKIKSKLMFIDDEADNASIDTSGPDGDITAINKQIRSILHLFKTYAYIGFTATPFANIFIDHAAFDTNVGKDLFPSDFICCLESPSNYIGARDIFPENGRCNELMLRYNDDAESAISISHNNSADLKCMPESLHEAICCFMLAVTIRNIEGYGKDPASMLVNMSPYINVQGKIYDTIGDECERIRSEILLNAGLNRDEALENKTMEKLYNTWKAEYEEYCINNEISWQDIQGCLAESIQKIKFAVVNSDKDSMKLDYSANPSMKVVAIGGNALSRGLTLEGLVISYFYRKSKSYDTLMQMGRWFGYRDGYSELCRVWMRKETADWYGYISDVTDQLRIEISEMKESGKTPEEFGLYVEQDIRGLFVTSHAKMRHTEEKTRYCTLNASQISTYKICIDDDAINKNYAAVKELISFTEHSEQNMSEYGNMLWTNIHKDKILKFIKNIDLADNHINADSLCEVISNAPELEYWDVAIKHGDSKITFPGTNSLHMVIRNKYRPDKGAGGSECISLNNRRLISPDDFKEGLSRDESERLSKVGNLKSEKRFLNVKRKPILLIYPLDTTSDKKFEENYSSLLCKRLKEIENEGKILMGFAFGFPQFDDYSESSKKEIKYVVNSVQMELDCYGLEVMNDE